MKDDTLGGCFPQGYKAALAEAKKAGKPLMTMENLNKIAKDTKANKILAQEMLKDVPAFFQQRFYLTPVQDAFLKSMVKAKSGDIIKVANDLVKQGGKVKFAEKITSTAPTANASGEGKVAPAPVALDKEISVSVEAGVSGIKGSFTYKHTQPIKIGS